MKFIGYSGRISFQLNESVGVNLEINVTFDLHINAITKSQPTWNNEIKKKY